MTTGTSTTTATAHTSSRFRQRKLNVKAHLTVVRETDLIDKDGHAIEGVDTSAESSRGGDALTSLPKLESGVESKEEKEHHLQAVINATAAAVTGGKFAQVFIPTPDAVEAEDVKYDQLYPKSFAQPATYIRFSSTVEDSTGTPYCMSEEDEIFLRSMNEKLGKGQPKCSEQQFESVMNSFEETSLARQPFAIVDGAPVLTFEEMESAFDEYVEDDARKFAAEIYEHWKVQRLERGNKSIMAKLKTLKMETGTDADDSDPYVCFRRREIRQARKTRGRDAQVVDKLKKLRKELEEARHILQLVREREHVRKDDLSLSRRIFEQRGEMREMKRTLGITGEEDDILLINQKTPKRKPAETPAPPARQSQQPKLPQSVESTGPSEFEMSYLREAVAQRDQTISAKISRQIAQHENWNMSYFDRTEEAILGLYVPSDEEEGVRDEFVNIKLGYLQQPTPPDSDASEPASEDEERRVEGLIRWAKDTELDMLHNETRYRKRIGRGGRLMLDRRPPKRQKIVAETPDRFRFDDSEEDELQLPDPFGITGFRYRESLRLKERITAEQMQAHRRATGQSSRDAVMSDAPSATSH